MKKHSVKLLSLVLIVVMLMCMFTGCAKQVEAGSYSGKLEIFGQSLKVTYTFKGNKVEAETKVTLFGTVNTESVSGTYEIIENADGTMEIKFDFEEENDYFKDQTLTFEQGEDYIKLGGATYTKAE